MKRALEVMNRRKCVDLLFDSPLRRCLVFWDLLLLGIGGSVDAAIYVVLGNVIRDIAGPAVLISMIVGFPVCFGAGLCYAEFASYIPSSGSDYDYIYTSLGEICGFFDGWSVLVGSVIATAALAQGAADLLRSLTDEIIYENTDAHVSLPDHALLSSNLNIVALLIITIVTIITAIGVHGSIRFNDSIVVLNLLVLAFTVILGLSLINFDYWSSWGKFAPYGVAGILKSLPFTIFFYGGFYGVTYSTEEVINPSQVMPRSIVSSILGIFIVYVFVGTVHSLVLPYYEIPLASPLSDSFGIVSFKASKYIIAFGGFCSCSSSVLIALYASSRLTYVMSRDGLILNFLSKVNKHTQIPLYSVIITGFIAGFLTVIFDLKILVELCSLLLLVPYTLLCFAVITLRYKENPTVADVTGTSQQLSLPDITTIPEQPIIIANTRNASEIDTNTTKQDLQPKFANNATVIINSEAAKDMEQPNDVETTVPDGSNGDILVHDKTKTFVNPEVIELVHKIFTDTSIKFRVKAALAVFTLSISCFAIVIRSSLSYSINKAVLGILVAVFILPLLVSAVVIWKTPYTKLKLPFTVPLFPILPLFCLGVTLFVIMQSSLWAWLLFGGNTLFGSFIYFVYGIKNSKVQTEHRMSSHDTVMENTTL